MVFIRLWRWSKGLLTAQSWASPCPLMSSSLGDPAAMMTSRQGRGAICGQMLELIHTCSTIRMCRKDGVLRDSRYRPRHCERSRYSKDAESKVNDFTLVGIHTYVETKAIEWGSIFKDQNIGLYSNSLQGWEAMMMVFLIIMMMMGESFN